MARLVSGRVKRFSQTGITSDRYQFLGLEQVEPNLGDPLVGPSSVGVNPTPAGDKYVLVSVPGYNGSRYWTQLQAIDYASNAGVATYATNAGVATYATNAGVATYATSAGIATYASLSGIATYATNAGVATYATNAGVATYAATAGIATALQNSRTFEITGDILASPISFDGSGNVSLAATIQPNSVGLGTDTTGNYVASIVNGSYITGGDGGSEGAALTIGVAATSNNTANQVVARDALGNFSAGFITANLVGIATTALNLADAANITTGTINSARLTGTYNIDISGNAATATNAGVATYAVNAGVATYATNAGVATYASVSGVATALQNSRTFDITGDIIASPISFNGTGNVSLGSTLSTTFSANTSGIITATRLSTGATGSAINVTSNTLSGPAEIIIDPAAVGDNTGAVRIKGDLYVDGTQTFINSTTIELADFNVGIATTIGTNSLLDGAGIGIGATSIRKTLTYAFGSDSLKSSENFDLASAKVYKINGVEVLNSTTLGSGVVNSSLTSVGTLGKLNVSGVTTSTGGFVGNLTGTATTATNLADAANITTGTINSARLTGTYNIDISGNASKATNAGVATYAVNAGVATYATNAGVATYAVNAGIATNVIGGIASVTSLTASGISTFSSAVYFNNNVGIQTTNALAPLHVSNGAIFNGSTSNELVRITQLGTGPALVVEHGTTPDTNSFVVNNSGQVGVGVTVIDAQYVLEVDGGDIRFVEGSQGDLIINHQNLVSNVRAAGGIQLGLGANGSDAVRINLNNNVGIGTTVAISKLHVVGDTYIAGILTANRIFSNVYGEFTGSSVVGDAIVGSALSVSGISTLGSVQISSGIVTATSGVVTYYGDGSKLTGVTGTQVVTQGAVASAVYPTLASNIGVSSIGISTTQLVFVPATGFLGIGTTNPTSKLHVIGDSYVTGIVTAFDFNSASDSSLKENIQPIENALDVACQLRGVTFDWKSTKKPSMGVIAQELEQILPDLVSDTDPKTVNYNGLIGILIEAIKELKQEVDQLKKNQN